MLGDHGVRFSLKHPDIMKAELSAMKEVALHFPNKIIGAMVPQVISLDEVQKTKAFAHEISMPKNVKIGIMVETPAAVQIINDLCEEGIDFISFGTNDLTQYTLAIDRNNTEVQHLYNEMNPAVLNSLAYVIRKCRKYGVKTSICGQAGSREDMARFLISQGIDSISVNADAAYKVSKLVAELESNSDSQDNPKEFPKEKRENQINQAHYQAKPQMPQINAQANESKDIEEVILKELDEPSPSQLEIDAKKEIPTLNDAIPVESEHLNVPKEPVKEEEIDLSEEWKGETKQE